MSFENKLTKFNEFHFYKEFTYALNTFSPIEGKEVELADNILSLDELMIVFQLKERIYSGFTTPDMEEKWFKKKIMGKAISQIKDTINYLETEKSIELINQKGNHFSLSKSMISHLHKVILYAPIELLPITCQNIKFHQSKTAGIIHIFPVHSYRLIVRTLLIPAEVVYYLLFRENLILKWGEVLNHITEHALIGQYLSGDENTRPSKEFELYLNTIDHRANEWDVSGIIEKFHERLVHCPQENDYYYIIKEIAKLKRSELTEFKKRLLLARQASKNRVYKSPYRIVIPRTGCGFIFIPLPQEMKDKWERDLEFYTLLHKYDQHLDKCIGVIDIEDGNGWFDLKWCYLNFPWENEQTLDLALREHPLRKVETKSMERYKFLPSQCENKHPPLWSSLNF